MRIRRPRRWVGIGGSLLALGCLLVGWLWVSRDPWPSRVVLPYPRSDAFMLAPRFSADGRQLLLTGVGGVHAWNLSTGQPEPPPANPFLLAPLTASSRTPILAPDRRSAIGLVEPSPQNGEVVWVDAASGAVRARFAAGSSRVEHLAFDSTGRSVRAVVREPDWSVVTVRWDLATGAETRHPVTGWPTTSGPKVIRPDGRLLAFVNQAQTGVGLLDLDTGAPCGELIAAEGGTVHPNVQPSFTADGQTLCLTRLDQQMELWSVPERRRLRTLALPTAGQALLDLAVAPDGQTLAVGAVNRPPTHFLARTADQLRRLVPGQSQSLPTDLYLIDATTGLVLARAHGSYTALFAPDGRSVVTFGMDETLSIRPVPTLTGR